jgi:hypothetical protein
MFVGVDRLLLVKLSGWARTNGILRQDPLPVAAHPIDARVIAVDAPSAVLLHVTAKPAS